MNTKQTNTTLKKCYWFFARELNKIKSYALVLYTCGYLQSDYNDLTPHYYSNYKN